MCEQPTARAGETQALARGEVVRMRGAAPAGDP